jgi:hypothetical protein
LHRNSIEAHISSGHRYEKNDERLLWLSLAFLALLLARMRPREQIVRYPNAVLRGAIIKPVTVRAAIGVKHTNGGLTESRACHRITAYLAP